MPLVIWSQAGLRLRSREGGSGEEGWQRRGCYLEEIRVEVPRAETLSAENGGGRGFGSWELSGPWRRSLMASCSFPHSRQNARGRHTPPLPGAALRCSAVERVRSGFLLGGFLGGGPLSR